VSLVAAASSARGDWQVLARSMRTHHVPPALADDRHADLEEPPATPEERRDP
jgi:hypothetical protein